MPCVLLYTVARIIYKSLMKIHRFCYFTYIRFGQLLQKETILICLEKEDPHLASSVLSLLATLVRSEDIVGLLSRHSEPCVLLTCYQSLLDPPSSAGKEMALKIQLQVCC